MEALQNRSRLKKIIAAAFAILLSICLLAPASPAEKTELETAYSGVLSYLSERTPQFGASGGEWLVFALARSGQKDAASEYFADYYKHIEKIVKQNGSAALHPRKSTENSRLVIALSSIGRDAGNVAGYNLIEPLYNFDYVVKQGLNGAVYALIALNCSREYGGADVKTKLIDEILERESGGGGWSVSGTGVDCDITAMAITALAPYERAKTAIERGIAALSKAQLADGGFLNSGENNADSAAQVVTALSSVGIDAAQDERFIKNGNSALAALLSFYTGKGFSHLPGGKVNAMATEQAACALCAYDRFKKGENTLFELSDASAADDYTAVCREKDGESGKKGKHLRLLLTAAGIIAVLLSVIYLFVKFFGSKNNTDIRNGRNQ